MLKEKLTAAINAKNNDVNSFIWKYARNKDRVQETIRLMDATPSQLQSFYNHCMSMLYSKDKQNPGRYTLLDIIKEQREKCDAEVFLRKLESGTLHSNNSEKYPRYLYRQDIREFMNNNKEYFPTNDLKNISINRIPGNIPKEFQRVSISSILDGCMDNLGVFIAKHITFTFILNIGVYFTPEEMRELNETDSDGNIRSKLEVVKERLRIPSKVRLTVKPTGLSYNELRSMINLKSKKYSELTTDQLNILRKKILFFLEQEIDYHIQIWEKKIKEINAVCKERDITLEEFTIS